MSGDDVVMATTLTVEQQLAAAIRQALSLTAKATVWEPLPHQVPPPGDWMGWLMLGGRFAGKTDAGAAYMVEHVKGPPCLKGEHPHWMGIVAPTLGDAGKSCFSGPSGIKAHDPSAEKVTTNEGTIVRWPNGSRANLFGTDTEIATDRLRSGGNNCLVWAEEIAAWRWLNLAWAHMLFGLRTGPHPRWIGSTTPKPRQKIKELAAPPHGVVVTHARSRDNPHITGEVIANLEALYGGTSLGEQELEGRIVEQDENALWDRDQIAKFRLTPEQAPLSLMRRRIVGVDPSGGAGEQGIIVVGFSDAPLNHPEHREPVARGFVLADYTCTLPPDLWGDRVIQAAIDWDADAIVAESDYGRDMPISIIQGAADRAGLAVPIKPALARAIGNKHGRAFPVAAKASRGRYPHVGTFEQLEDQLCTWTEEAKYSPDRLDAAVWPAWFTGLVTITFTGAGTLPGVAAASTSLAPFRRR
jgi:phage terminase large subunit-like protein